MNRVDNMVIQAIALLDTLDKDVNTFVMRVREWYSWHFPELVQDCERTTTSTRKPGAPHQRQGRRLTPGARCQVNSMTCLHGEGAIKRAELVKAVRNNCQSATSGQPAC